MRRLPYVAMRGIEGTFYLIPRGAYVLTEGGGLSRILEGEEQASFQPTTRISLTGMFPGRTEGPLQMDMSESPFTLEVIGHMFAVAMALNGYGAAEEMIGRQSWTEEEWRKIQDEYSAFLDMMEECTT